MRIFLKHNLSSNSPACSSAYVATCRGSEMETVVALFDIIDTPKLRGECIRISETMRYDYATTRSFFVNHFAKHGLQEVPSIELRGTPYVDNRDVHLVIERVRSMTAGSTITMYVEVEHGPLTIQK